MHGPIGGVAKIRLVGLTTTVAACFLSVGCGSPTKIGVPPVVGPTVTFNPCLIPAGQPTWANILLTGAKGPFRAIWSIDGKVDSSDPQRTVAAPGKGTRLELLVTLTGVGQTFRIQAFNALGSLGTFSFTNTANGDPRCNAAGEPPPSKN
jgi:hypothetical protein